MEGIAKKDFSFQNKSSSAPSPRLDKGPSLTSLTRGGSGTGALNLLFFRILT
jgi:hypothetical protein